MRCAPFFAVASTGECTAICWQIKFPAPIMPRIVSSNVVRVRLSPLKSWYGAKYLISGSFQVVFHSIFLPPHCVTSLLLITTLGGRLEL